MSVYRNAGDLFDTTRLSEIATFPEWKAAPIDVARRGLEELYEKREAQIEEGLDRKKTSYYWTSYALRVLGFVSSVAERTPTESDDDTRADFTLFYDADEFNQALDYRGTRGFFSNAIGVIRSLGWDESLDEFEVAPEGEPNNPAYGLDRVMRNASVTWGILTNGRLWRLYHRDTSGLMTTFYEVDLLAALQSNDVDDFRYFWLVFSPAGLGGLTRGDSIVDRLYD